MALFPLITRYSNSDKNKVIVKVPESKLRQFIRQMIAEFIGTAFFVFMVVGSVVSATFFQADGVIRIVLIAFIQAFSLATIVWFTSGVSGCQLNPAVTCSLITTSRMGFFNGLAFVIMQACGALAGASLAKAATPGPYEGDLGATTINPDISIANAFFLEFMATSLLCMVVLSMSVFNEWDQRLGRYAPLAIGCAVYAGVALLGPWTGGSLNPARSFGSATLSGVWHDHWLYWAAPIAGGIVTGLVWRFILREKVALVDRPYSEYAPNKYGVPRISSSSSTKNHYGSTPIHEAVRRGEVEMVKFLLTQNADLTIGDIDDNTPLHLAIMCEDGELIPILLEAGAPLDLKNKDNDTPAQVTQDKEILDFIQEFIKYKAEQKLKQQQQQQS
ncbi:aquaporin-like protein [Heterostelium album PN500]|uniref:Aquaporin-like protein n=1 Tax=Heterostelium pallidum (strain ATCC 26659 / Pp 5 / PN500) TaxID=670386 RepID=D3BQ27_HETP5|nr:aquaporin-like protein [Heterostelium album PN500]EFA76578.1 aquaporin-like protein [Heterostelium album PN500]|eukprot:XP_020428710.1 aquaporin-like protein [Heterostelium album PN500]